MEEHPGQGGCRILVVEDDVEVGEMVVEQLHGAGYDVVWETTGYGALQALQRDIQASLYQQAIGRVETVLVDSRSRRRHWELSGRTSGNTVVNFSGDPGLMGQLVPVRITAANPNSLRGEPVAIGAGDAVPTSADVSRFECKSK